jgi:hypothetical protein
LKKEKHIVHGEYNMLQQKNKTPIALHVKKKKKKVEYDDEILRGVA